MDSNGYIMLDFSPIDFSKKNQVIYGLFDRISDVKAVNKFIIILNIQGNKTPLPAVMTYINNSYVIESFLYNFTITSDDNIRIDNVSADIIKDGIISAGSTWSSQKINNEIISIIDDDFVSDNTTWSSNKINDIISHVGLDITKIYEYTESYRNDINIVRDITIPFTSYNFLIVELSLGDLDVTHQRFAIIPILKTNRSYFGCVVNTRSSAAATSILFSVRDGGIFTESTYSSVNIRGIWGF